LCEHKCDEFLPTKNCFQAGNETNSKASLKHKNLTTSTLTLFKPQTTTKSIKNESFCSDYIKTCIKTG
jgi:hypothetical protein